MTDTDKRSPDSGKAKLGALCRKCRRTMRQLLLEAMLIDAGAKVYPDPRDCEHEFSETAEK